jgi:hypothetical protein
MRRTFVIGVVLLVVGATSASTAANPRACGSAWTVATQPAPPPGSSELLGVSAFSSTEAWAVGDAFDGSGTTHSLVERWVGTSWAFVPAADGPNAVVSTLSGVVERASDDAWAVGSYATRTALIRTLTEHWDGASWSRIRTPNAGHPRGGSLTGVAALAADDVWAVGGFGQGAPGRTLVEHWDGTAWSIVPSPNKGGNPNALAAVAAVAPDDVWAVGSWFTRAFVDRTLVLHWDGTRWRRVASPNVGKGENRLVGVTAIAADDVWAVGSRGLHTLTEHWDGTSWSVVPSPTPGGNADLAAVAAAAINEVWAVGGRVDRQANAIQTLVERWDGSSWRVVMSANEGPSDNHLWDVTAVTGRAFAVGDRFRSGGGPPAPLALERCGA